MLVCVICVHGCACVLVVCEAWWSACELARWACMHVLVAVFSRLLAAAGGDGCVKRVACMAGLIVCMQRIASWRNVGGALLQDYKAAAVGVCLY